MSSAPSGNPAPAAALLLRVTTRLLAGFGHFVHPALEIVTNAG